MYLIRSPAVSLIKKNMGQNNHFLITCLVGLDLVKDIKGNLSPAFSPQWKPESLEVSSLRSREYILKLSLAWIVDCMDGYFITINRKPTFIEDAGVRNSLNGERVSQSIYLKLNLFGEYLGLVSHPSYSFAHLAVAWRNRIIHSESLNDITEEQKEVLIKNAELIQEKHSGLIVQELLADFYSRKPIKQKIVGSFCKAVQELLYEIDRKLLEKIDIERYMKAILHKHFNDYENNMRLKWSRPIEEREKVLSQIFYSKGFAFKVDHISREITARRDFALEILKNFSSQSIDELMKSIKDTQ